MNRFAFLRALIVSLVLLAASACGEEAKEGPIPCADESSASCSACLSEALGHACGDAEERSLTACDACEPMSGNCDRESCEAARLSRWQCWDEAARERCGGAGLPPPAELPEGGEGGAGGGGGGPGGTGGKDPVLVACVEMCAEVYGTCKTVLPGRGIEGSCVYACHAGKMPAERVACILEAGCVDAEIVACFDEPGAGGSGGSGGAEEPPIVDRCDGIPEAGVCSGSETLLRCKQAPGRNQLIVFAKSCEPRGACEETEEGAACVPHEDTCTGSDALCVGDELRRCVRGSWEGTICEGGCKVTPYGAVCEPLDESETFSGRIFYEARAPNPDLSDWGGLVELPAAGLLVISYRGDDYFDSSEVQEDGSFSVQVPSPRSASDRIYFYAYSAVAVDQTPFAVASSGKQPGTYAFSSTGLQSAAPHHWALASDAKTGDDWLIREDKRSAAIFFFQWMKRALAFSALHHGKPGTPILLWWDDGVEWRECAACFTRNRRLTLLGRTYNRHILFSHEPSDHSHWSTPVIVHELGHWEMDSYGYSPNEGGLHCMGARSLPGLAWSEGWATFFSSDVRADARYWDKQGGTFFWMDFARMRYYEGTSFPRPSSQGSLDQLMSEDWIAGSLWKFSRDERVLPSAPYQALRSARMTEPPFARGYTTRRPGFYWFCEPYDIIDTGRPAPMLADFLDAIRCGGVTASVVRQHFQPYPYPFHAPICD